MRFGNIDFEFSYHFNQLWKPDSFSFTNPEDIFLIVEEIC